MAQDSDRDVREEVGISLFWRDLIGDYEYGRFNPDDMLRWYDALQLRGPEEIRDLVNERYTGRPVSAVQGIVSGAPHPPIWLIREWLGQYENTVSLRPYWLAAAGFVLLCFMVMPTISGMTRLTPLSTYIMHPPFGGPQVYEPASPLAGGRPTAAQNAPPAVAAQGSTGPQSGGIAGVATGATPAGGRTGATNSGVSAGSISPAPAISSYQP